LLYVLEEMESYKDYADKRNDNEAILNPKYYKIPEGLDAKTVIAGARQFKVKDIEVFLIDTN